MEYVDLLLPPTNPLQLYGLVFLLGSLSVSSLSDLKRLAAQADFAQVWAAFTVAMFIADTYLSLIGELNVYAFALKWALILLTVASTSGAHLLGISTMDSAALAALLSLLTPAYVLLALVLTVFVNELLQPLLRGYGEAGAYPFLPTLFAVNLILILVIAAGGMEPYLGLEVALTT